MAYMTILQLDLVISQEVTRTTPLCNSLSQEATRENADTRYPATSIRMECIHSIKLRHEMRASRDNICGVRWPTSEPEQQEEQTPREGSTDG